MRFWPAVIALFGLGIAGSVPVAAAAVLDWSGMDVRHYDGPLPAPGTLLQSVPLSPALSVSGAAQAYRILYSTIDQHDSPAVSTAAVFTPRGEAPEGGWPTVRPRDVTPRR